MNDNYRYRLTRTFKAGAGRIVFVMLNPSTADEDTDDPTIRRCIGFAMRDGFRELRVVNLFARRSTKPSGILSEWGVAPTMGEEQAWAWAFADRPFVVAAWGAHTGPLGRMIAARVPLVLAEGQRHGVTFRALGLSKKGHPRHPLYLPASARPFEFRHPLAPTP